MAARRSDSRSRLNPIIWIVLVIVILAVVGYLSWRTFFVAARDYCKSPEDFSKVTREFCHMQEKEIQLVNDAGQTIKIKARIADEVEEQQTGYQRIDPEVIANSFILFVSDKDINAQVHMCNVSAPLDIVWIRADGSIVDTKEMDPGPSVPPAECKKFYGPEGDGAYRYALEARKDFLKDKNLTKSKSHLVIESLK